MSTHATISGPPARHGASAGRAGRHLRHPWRLGIALLVAARLCPALPAADTPAPSAVAEPTPSAWLVPLLRAAREVVHSQPEVIDAELTVQASQLGTRVAGAQWNPRVSVSPSYGQSQTVSNSVVDGPGIIRTQSGSTSVTLSKPFATGTAVSVGASSSGSRSDGAGVISDDFYSSSVYLAISQNLLRGNSRELNLAGVQAALDAETASREQFAGELEARYSDLAVRWLDLALSEASIAQLRSDVGVAKDNLRQFEERLKIGLSRELDVLSLRRGVADQEVQLAKAERTYAADLRQLGLYWPGLALPKRTGLLSAPRPEAPATVSFAASRQGQATLRAIAGAARDLAVARNNALDDLGLDASLSKYGTDGDLGGSWAQLDDRHAFDWRVGLAYSHTFGTEANRVAHQRAMLALDQARLRGRIAERDWHAQGLLLHDAFADAVARVTEQERLLVAERNELTLATAQVEAGIVTTRDLVDARQRVSSAVLALYRANLDVLRADLQLRVHDNRLLGLIP
jgi:outer membrane protein TolC